MRVLQGGFPRLRCVMPQNSAVRAKILTCVLHLCNLRTRAMEINQIRTVFDPNYVPNIFNTKTASRIRQFYDPMLYVLVEVVGVVVVAVGVVGSIY